MASYTENYNLTKPDEADYYDIAEFNANMDAIDEGMAETAAEVAGVSEKIGDANDESSNTLFGKLNMMNSDGTSLRAIKSIQHAIYSQEHGTTSGTVSINIVKPTNCIVLFERLASTNNAGTPVNYTLQSNSIEISHNSTSGGTYTYGFWIIEFC